MSTKRNAGREWPGACEKTDTRPAGRGGVRPGLENLAEPFTAEFVVLSPP